MATRDVYADTYHCVRIRQRSHDHAQAMREDARSDNYPGEFWDCSEAATHQNGTPDVFLTFEFSDPNAALEFKMRWA